MSALTIYVEGGGGSKEGNARLRQGISEFVRKVIPQQKPGWKVVACGSRDDTYRAFQHANTTRPENFNVLLVDSEDAVAPYSSPRSHLSLRDGWQLSGASDDSIHLMIRVMETWIVADLDTLEKYYGQQFLSSALPSRSQNVEQIEKKRIFEALERATAKTQKGEYHKIRHAAALLERIRPEIVRQRCPSCERFFVALGKAMDAA